MTGEAGVTVSHDHANVRWDDDAAQWVYRMSAVGVCPVSLLWERTGVQASNHTPPAMQKVFAEGHANEQVCVDLWLAANPGFEVVGADETVTLRVGPVRLEGHTDRTVAHGPNRYVWEGKSLGDALWKEWGKRTPGSLPEGKLWDKYRKQLACYMAATGLPAAFCVGRKVDGVVVEVSWEWFQAGALGDVLEEVKRGVLDVERKARGDVSGIGCPGVDYPCGHYYLHDEKDEVEAVGISVALEAGKLWADACATYATASASEAGAKKIKAAAREVMVEAMGTLGITPNAGNVFEGGGWRVTWVEREVAEKVTKAYVMKYPKVEKKDKGK